MSGSTIGLKLLCKEHCEDFLMAVSQGHDLLPKIDDLNSLKTWLGGRPSVSVNTLDWQIDHDAGHLPLHV